MSYNIPQDLLRQLRRRKARTAELERLVAKHRGEAREWERLAGHANKRAQKAEEKHLEHMREHAAKIRNRAMAEMQNATGLACWISWCNRTEDPDNKTGLCKRCFENVKSWKRERGQDASQRVDVREVRDEDARGEHSEVDAADGRPVRREQRAPQESLVQG